MWSPVACRFFGLDCSLSGKLMLHVILVPTWIHFIETKTQLSTTSNDWLLPDFQKIRKVWKIAIKYFFGFKEVSAVALWIRRPLWPHWRAILSFDIQLALGNNWSKNPKIVKLQKSIFRKKKTHTPPKGLSRALEHPTCGHLLLVGVLVWFVVCQRNLYYMSF